MLILSVEASDPGLSIETIGKETSLEENSRVDASDSGVSRNQVELVRMGAEGKTRDGR